MSENKKLHCVRLALVAIFFMSVLPLGCIEPTAETKKGSKNLAQNSEDDSQKSESGPKTTKASGKTSKTKETNSKSGQGSDNSKSSSKTSNKRSEVKGTTDNKQNGKSTSGKTETTASTSKAGSKADNEVASSNSGGVKSSTKATTVEKEFTIDDSESMSADDWFSGVSDGEVIIIEPSLFEEDIDDAGDITAESVDITDTEPTNSDDWFSGVTDGEAIYLEPALEEDEDHILPGVTGGEEISESLIEDETFNEDSTQAVEYENELDVFPGLTDGEGIIDDSMLEEEMPEPMIEDEPIQEEPVEEFNYEEELDVFPGTTDGETIIMDFPLKDASEPEIVLLFKPNTRFAADKSANVKLPPVADLEGQVDALLKKISSTIEDLDGSVKFADDADALYRDANALALVALALGLSEENNKYKKAAPAIIDATMKLEKATSLDEATKLFAELKKSTSINAESDKLEWKKVASLKPIMKAVPNINTVVKRNLRNESALKKGVQRVIEGSATLAAISQGCIPNADDTIKPEAKQEWTDECIKFRDISLELNKKAHDFADGKASHEDIEAVFDKLTESCNSCHTHFFSGTIEIE
ncbi:MAG: hypothetical protein ACRC2T_06455 [Thermoguttaceae bacterium]